MTENIQEQEQLEQPEVIVEEKERLELEPNKTADLKKNVDALPTGKSEPYVNTMAHKLALLKKQVFPESDVNVLYEEVRQNLVASPNARETAQAYQEMYANDLLAKSRTYLDSVFSGRPEEANTVDRVVEETLTQYSGLEGMQRALTDAYSNESPANRAVREQEALAYEMDIYNEWAEQRGVLDKVMDGLGLLEPISFTKDTDDLMSDIAPDLKGAGIDNFEKFISNYQSLDPEVKMSVFKELFPKMVKAFDNNEFKIAATIGLLHDPNFSSEIELTGGLEAVEVGSFLASAPLTAPWKLVKTLKNGSYLRKRLANLNNKRAAIDATKNSNSKMGEAMDADPTNWENTILGDKSVDGLSGEYQKMIDEIKAEVQQPMEELFEETAAIKLGPLSDREKEAAQTTALKALRQSSNENKRITGAEIVNHSDRGFTIKYRVEDETGSLRVNQEYKYSIDDVGTLIAEDPKAFRSSKSVFGGKFLSADNLIRDIDDKLVDDVTRSGLQTARYRNQFKKVFDNTDKGLSNESKTKVDELIVAGDQYIDDAGNRGAVFKPGDLSAGNVQTISGKRSYTPEEIKAYYAKRALLDEDWKFKNYLTKKKLEFQGYQEARWMNTATGTEQVQIAKPFKNGQGFTTDSAEDIIAPGIINSEANVVKRGQINVADAIEKGYTPVKFLKPVKIGDKKVSYGLIPNGENLGSINKLPEQVLNKTVGHLPLIRKPGYYYVKDTASDNATVAFAKTREEAQKYIDDVNRQQEELQVPAGERMNLQYFADRDMDATDALIEDANAYGGLYTGARSQTPLFAIGEAANEVNRLSTGQSIQRSLEAISSQMPINEYRLAVIQKWKNTVKDVLKQQGYKSDDPVFRQVDDPTAWKEMQLGEISNQDLRKALLNHRDYMFDHLSVSTNQERAWQRFMMNIADRLPNSKVRDSVVNIASKKPDQALKGSTFDAYLGWFNPRQLYIQMQNASLAASMYPKHALGSFKDAMIQRVALYSDNIDKDALARAAKGVTEDSTDDLIQSLEQFKRSGLRDGVMRQGDYATSMNNLGGGTLDGYRKLAAKGRIFFEEGESMARLISWNIARRNWKEQNPGKVIDDKAISDITTDTLRMNMNMQRENSAWWQKNPLTAVPTQFLQVQAKLVENLVGSMTGKGRWTKKEAAMVFGGQLALYGMAGVPFVEDVSNVFKTGVEGDPMLYAKENPTWNSLLDRGFIGTTFNALGFENNFSEPASILAGLDDNVVMDIVESFAAVASNESREISFSAPSIGVIQRGADAMGTLADSVRNIATVPSLETLGTSAFNTIDSFAAISSTWSNARKIVFLHKLGGIVDSRGDISISESNLEDVSTMSLVAKAMGMSLDVEDAYYKQALMNYDIKKQEQDTKKALKEAYRQYTIDGNLEVFNNTRAWLLSEYEGQPLRRSRLNNEVLRTINESRSKLDRAIKQGLSNVVRSNGQVPGESFQANILEDNRETE